MKTHGLPQQLRDNLVAITSLVVALSALGYNTWRNEQTERNRNVRVAGIEILREIGSFQQVVFYARFVGNDDPRGELRMGWVDVATIGDLAVVMPPDVARDAAALRAVWEEDAASFVDDEAAFARIDDALERLRRSTVESLRGLR